MNNDFISLFKALKPADKAGFKPYILYFYGQQKVILQIFECVEKYLDDADTSNLVFAEAASISKAEDARKNTQNALHDLKIWLIEFLTTLEIRSNTYEAKLLTIETLRKHGLHQLSAKKSEQFKQELLEHPSPDIGLKLLSLRLAHADYFTTEIDKLKNQQTKMQELLNQLDNFYIGTKLIYSAELQSRTDILQETYNSRLFDSVLILAETDASLNPIIKNIYLPLFKLIKDKSETAYRELKAFFSNDGTHDPREKLAILIYLLNFAAARLRQKSATYHQEYFDLAQIGIKQSLFIAAGSFPTMTFINIVNTACHLKKYDSAEQFIKQWSPFLKSADRLVAENLASARVHFERDRFPEAINLLDKTPIYKNVHLAIHNRILLAAAYFENDSTNSLQIRHCDNSMLFVRRSKNMNEGLKKNVLGFFNILRLLINKKDKEQLLKARENTNGPIAFQDWLNKKMDASK